MTEQQTDRIEQFRKAFEKVQDRRDWKAPIETVVPLAEADLTLDAIEFYTATRGRLVKLEYLPDGRMGVLLKADGYRAGPAGDH